jgi:uncharacterized protein (UPF0548 family)
VLGSKNAGRSNVGASLTDPVTAVATAAAWPLGIALTSWHYMWRTTPFHRREILGSASKDVPAALPSDLSHDEVQLVEDGVGPLFHRRYRVTIRGATLSAEELMALVSTDPNRAVPSEFARFTKTLGSEGRMEPGDEFSVRMPGPWNGPVRVVAVSPTSFRLATLEGHLEAGQIQFAAHQDDGLVFSIESWARSGDRLSKLLYQNLRMAKEVQLHMWTSFLERVVDRSGGRIPEGIDIDTWRIDEPDGRGGSLSEPETKRLLDEMHERAVNFNLEQRRDFTPANGWKIDEYHQALPAEAPGPPVPNGSWEVACRLARNYEFADPAIVRAVYDADQPLQERTMLLEARFYGLRFRLGVRVGGVHDDSRDVDGRKVRVWGWNYRTLKGHLEMGQIDYEVWKWLDSGEVEFRISALSRPASIPNPVVRLGFHLFGRREQVKFAHHACRRMAELTAAALDKPDEAVVT